MPKLTDPELLRADAYVDGGLDRGRRRQDASRCTNPATGETLAEVADLDAADARAAIEAAAAAFPAWARQDRQGARRDPAHLVRA